MAELAPLSPIDLRLAITRHFDGEDLRTLCFDVGVDYDDLRGEGKEAKARELVALAERTGCLEALEATVRRLRPELPLTHSYERVQDWPDFYEQRTARGRGIRTLSVRVALGCLIAVAIMAIVAVLWGDLLPPILIPARTPTVTATVSIKTATPMPTATLQAMPTLHPTSMPTFTPPPPSTPGATPGLTLTSTPLVYPPPTLIRPDILNCTVTLKWDWVWGLAEDEWFAVRVAKMPGVPHSFVWTKENAHTWSPEEAGEFTWEVVVCRGDPASALCEPLAASERGNFIIARCTPKPSPP